jgi:hypothetical protein
MTWQPISTAPKDRPVLVHILSDFGRKGVLMAEWQEWSDSFGVYSDGEPLRDATHWCELPEPP